MNADPVIRDQRGALCCLAIAGPWVVVDDRRRKMLGRQVQQQCFQSPLLAFGVLVAAQKSDGQARVRRLTAWECGLCPAQERTGVPVPLLLDAIRVRARAGQQVDAQAVDRGFPPGADTGLGQRGEVSPLRQEFDEADANVVLRVAANGDGTRQQLDGVAGIA